TSSTPLPAGSSTSQSSYRLPGKKGQVSPQPMVMTTSAALTNSSVSGFGNSLDRSTPSSLITSTAAGLISAAGALPAERTLTLSPAYSANNPAALWPRPA